MKAMTLKDGKMESNPKALGEMIVRYREMNDISQREFARKCGISNATISRLENGLEHETEVRVMYIISKTLDLNFFEVFGALYPKIYEEYKDAFDFLRIYENNLNVKQQKVASEIVHNFNKLFG